LKKATSFSHFKRFRIPGFLDILIMLANHKMLLALSSCIYPHKVMKKEKKEKSI